MRAVPVRGVGPRTTDLPLAMGIPAGILVPRDRRRLRTELQRDVRRSARVA